MILDFAVVILRNVEKGLAALGAVSTADPRLSDARTPTGHTHASAEITDLAARLALKQDSSAKGKALGYCELDAQGLVPSMRLPAVSATGVVPIGAIIAWAKSFAGVPSLPAQFAECDGSVIADAASPMNGQTLPNLNATFLRGSTTSGTTGGAATHTHTLTTGIENTDSDVQSDSGSPVTVAAAGHTHSGTTDAGSTLPPYYEVVWVMRIK